MLMEELATIHTKGKVTVLIMFIFSATFFSTFSTLSTFHSSAGSYIMLTTNPSVVGILIV